MSRFVGVLGILVILGICWLMSTDRRAVRWRTVAWGVALQLALGLLLLRTGVGRSFFVDHGSLVRHEDCSTYRTKPDWQTLYRQNKQLFEQKWQGVAA